MTKRFTTKNGVFYTDNLTGWEFQSYGEVVKLMNELSEENEQLNKSRDELISENRHIKKTIQTMLINERTVMGKSVLKQLADNLGVEL